MANHIKLPELRYDSKVSIEQCLINRRSIRSYTNKALTMEEISQLVWAAQGITGSEGYRTIPSAGALYPLETYVVAGNVQELPPGIYRYHPGDHHLIEVTSGDIRDRLAKAALGQSCIHRGAASIVLSAVYKRTTIKYGSRGIRYTHIEAGHAAQNVLLEATAMGLGTAPIGAFNDEQVARAMSLPENEIPLYILPIGRI